MVFYAFRDGKPHLPIHTAEEGARKHVHRTKVLGPGRLGVSIIIIPHRKTITEKQKALARSIENHLTPRVV